MEIKVFVLLAECLLLGLVRGATIAPLEEYREQDTISPMPVESSELAEINEADVPDVWVSCFPRFCSRPIVETIYIGGVGGGGGGCSITDVSYKYIVMIVIVLLNFINI